MILESTISTVEEAAANVEQSVSLVKQTMDEIGRWLLNKSGSLIVAIVFIFVGIKLTGLLIKLAKRGFDRSRIDESVAGFLLSVLRIVGYILVFITAATIVGIEVTSFVAILTTASMAIGLALQGALSNLAGGMLILLLKPFKVGDYIVEGSNEGTVISIDIFYTRLLTHDNRLVVIPNGLLTNNSLVNVTSEAKRKLEVTISVAYNTDLKRMIIMNNTKMTNQIPIISQFLSTKNSSSLLEKQQSQSLFRQVYGFHRSMLPRLEN